MCSLGGAGGWPTIIGLRIYGMLYDEGRREVVRETSREGKTWQAEES